MLWPIWLVAKLRDLNKDLSSGKTRTNGYLFTMSIFVICYDFLSFCSQLANGVQVTKLKQCSGRLEPKSLGRKKIIHRKRSGELEIVSKRAGKKSTERPKTGVKQGCKNPKLKNPKQHDVRILENVP